MQYTKVNITATYWVQYAILSLQNKPWGQIILSCSSSQTYSSCTALTFGSVSVEMYLKERGWGGIDWLHEAQNTTGVRLLSTWWWNFRFHDMQEIWASWGANSFSRGPYFM